MLSKTIGSNVKYYRFQKKLSQEQLSELLNLSTKYISDIESGKYNMSISTLENLSEILNVDPYKFLMSNPQSKNLPSRIDIYWKNQKD